MKQVRNILVVLLAFIAGNAAAQVGVGITTPDASAQLDVTATGKGLLIPRMTLANRPASPATGLMIYQTDGTQGFYYYDGSTWQMLSNTASAASAFNDTLIRNLYTDGYLISADGSTGIKMYSNGILVDTGIQGTGSGLAVSGAGTRMIWYPKSSAFRAGSVLGSNWDDGNIGIYSAAFGYDNLASGTFSLVAGQSCRATAAHTMVAGYSSSATQDGAIALGNDNNATGASATALGRYSTASGFGSVSLGYDNNASGTISIAAGGSANASGNFSIALGNSANASGNHSVAMGSNASTNGKAGSFMFADSTSGSAGNDAENQMMMRFNGGYKLYTSSSGTQGAELTNTGVLKYMNNVSGSYDARSLTDKGYVDSVISVAATTAAFNDTLTRNLYTSGYLVTADGATGLSMGSNGLLMDTGTLGAGASLTISGAGTRMFWYPKKAAFRAGALSGSQWDDANIGSNSVAFGWNNTASGSQSSAFGQWNTVSGNQGFGAGYQNTVSSFTAAGFGFLNNSTGSGSMALGQYNTASGTGSIAAGFNNTSSGYGSVAQGYNNTASNMGAVAQGLYNTASNMGAVAMGSSNTASGLYGFAMGRQAMATGNNSVAIGYNVSTNNKQGSFIFGDTTAASLTTNDAANQMMMRFNGGYKLYTNSTGTQGAQLTSAGVLKYMNNVSGSYDTRSLTDKGYVDSVVSASATASVFDDTLLNNLYTNGYLVTADGTTGIKMFANGILMDTGTYNSGSDLAVSGAGTRMFWYPKAAAFRAGKVGGSQWDAANVGIYSSAFGTDNIANASASVALGNTDTASGANSFVAGSASKASGSAATSFGNNNQSTGNGSLVAGTNSKSSGWGSSAFGIYVTASNTAAVAMGSSNIASGQYTFAAGRQANATGDNSVAMGYNVNTNSKQGSFIFGDTTAATSTANDANNQMMMRFAGGYKLYSNSSLTQGLTMATNGATTLGTSCVASGPGAVAAGSSDTASGYSSIAMGSNNKSSNNSTIALGTSNIASGASSIAIGNTTTASGNTSMATGYNSVSSGWGSFTAGLYTTANNTAAVAMGSSNTASGQYSTVLGYNSTASGNYSLAAGTRVSTNGKSGSFIFGDSTASISTNNDAVNQMMMRFNGGYKLYTNSTGTQGAQLTSAGVLKYMNNVSGSYDTRSLTDKGYVDSVSKISFNDTLIRNLYTSGYMITPDGTSGITLGATGRTSVGYNSSASGNYSSTFGLQDTATGDASLAMGYLNKATGVSAVALGYQTTSSGSASTAVGYLNTASGTGSLAGGQSCNASGWGAIAFGLYNTASNTGSVALGSTNSATGQYALAMGRQSNASADQATAIGNHAMASGGSSLAIGTYVNTNGMTGSFILADSSTTTYTNNDAANQMMMRFSGGYKLFTNSAATQGVQIGNDGVVKYTSNVSGSYDSRSLTDKNYVDSVSRYNFNDTLTRNLYTNGFTVTPDGTSGINLTSNGRTAGGFNSYVSADYGTAFGLRDTVTAPQAVAMGNVNKALNNASIAIGTGNTASGNASVAIGANNASSGTASLALGSSNTSSATNAIALGNNLTASGASSVAIGSYVSTNALSGSLILGDNSTTTATTIDAANQMKARFTGGYKLFSNSGLTSGLQLTTTGGSNLGTSNTVSGTNATGIGNTVTASATNAVAIGFNATSSGIGSVAMGSYVSTNAKNGSFVIGDSSTTTVTTASTTNQMTMRFANGYRLYTNSTASVGAQIAPGGNSWSTISDRNKKENFAKVNGEDFLAKIAKMPLSSWNYKGQDAKYFRHYGPMAQDFFAAFGRDAYGTSGNDTTINQADMEGVSFIAIQALERRTQQLQKENAELRSEMEQMKNDFAARLEKIEAAMNRQPARKDAVPVK